MSNIKVRFAPSPTGPLHIGGARSALFNFLYAENQGGTLVLRSEDTDLERSKPEYEQEIIESLKWLGLTWGEGLEVGGANGPYRQTERLDIYSRYIDKLMQNGHAYHCFCTEEELDQERKTLMEKGDMPRYMGRCRHLTDQERQEKIAQGIAPTVRFKVPENEMVVVDDLVRGNVSFETSGIGDFIIVKSDGIPTYNFAVVIDDCEMGITHVVRAEEHLSNTPRQLLIYQALDLKPPKFAHISLILGKDRQKMSKRHGATSVIQYREQGYLPEALFNFLALLGWSPDGEEQILNSQAIIQQFSLDRVAKNPAVFDLDKLNWMNAQYIKKLTPERLGELIKPFLEESLAKKVAALDSEALQVLMLEIQERLVCLNDVNTELQPFVAEPEYSSEALEILRQDDTREMLKRVLSMLPEKFEIEATHAMFKELPKTLDLPGKKVYMPLRVALTGASRGPELPVLLVVMGGAQAKKRLEDALLI
ncbi:MAG: glutamate--tRNA ligase [Candidatus Saccharibacteria bacterium]